MPLSDMLLNALPDGSALPHVTPSILHDAFAEQGVLLGGKASEHRVLRWFASASVLEEPSLDESPVPLSHLLLAAEFEDIPELLIKFPQAYLIAQTSNETKIEELRAHENRLLIVRACGDFLHFALSLQNFFLRMLLWESDMERIVLRNGSLAELLDSSMSHIGNFIFISDNDFNVISFTSAIAPPDDMHAHIIAQGSLTPQTIAEERFRLPEKTFYARKADELTPYDRVSYPIHFHHTYLGSISMSCNMRPDSAGLRDLFKLLIKNVRVLFERVWTDRTSYNMPSYFFYSKLLRHEPLAKEHLEQHIRANHLPTDGHLKLIAFDVDPSIKPDLALSVARAASTLNEGRTHCFPYEHNVLALCYGSNDDGELSHRKTTEEVSRKIRSVFDIDCGISSIFSDICDLDLAHKQAHIALGFRKAIDREHTLNSSASPRGIYLFEDALMYYLVDPMNSDKRFIDFTFSTSIVNILWNEDKREGTDHLALLWFYLQTERNATLTAQRMHMHRNTILYRIEKIEKRFDFSLSEKTARDWLLLSFKLFFSTQSSESLSAIFDEDV